MIKTTLLRAAPVILAVAAFGAHAQTTTTEKVQSTVVKTEDKVANSRPVQATKKGVKRATNAVKRAGSKTASAIRNTGNKINEKVPPGPNDPKN